MASKYVDIAPIATSILTDEEIVQEFAKADAEKAAIEAAAAAIPVQEPPVRTAEMVKCAMGYARYLGHHTFTESTMKYKSNGPLDILRKINADMGCDCGFTQDEIVALREEWNKLQAAINAPPPADPAPIEQPKEEGTPIEGDLGGLG